ncbi:hypothetical protein ACTXLK_12330 [Psychrobacter faecalis]
MTAVVAILNKTGMALAADSAATITNGDKSTSKVFNTANKVFTLSKHHPVAIMIFNNAEFLYTPWELIIKLYRKNLKKKSFRTVKEYSDDFRKFLIKNELLNFRKKEKAFLTTKLQIIVSKIINDVGNQLLDQGDYDTLSVLQDLDSYEDIPSEKIDSVKKIASILESIIDQDIIIFNALDKIEGLDEVDLKSFKQSNEDFIYEIIDDVFIKSTPLLLHSDNIEGLRAKIADLFINILSSNYFLLGFTGLVFVGYGNEQLYPALYSIQTDGVVSGSLRYSVTNDISISDERDCYLVPFAQTDVMDTFIQGMNPELYNVVNDSLYKSLSSNLDTYNDTIVANTKGKVDEALLETLKQEFKESIMVSMQNNIQSVLHNSHIQPTLQALKFLSKEDLAELAESLIYLTFLKRRTTSSLESVGGAIDVAIISKGDGFIWKKRKHYFEDKLNQHFFQNYFDQ